MPTSQPRASLRPARLFPAPTGTTPLASPTYPRSLPLSHPILSEAPTPSRRSLPSVYIIPPPEDCSSATCAFDSEAPPSPGTPDLAILQEALARMPPPPGDAAPAFRRMNRKQMEREGVVLPMPVPRKRGTEPAVSRAPPKAPVRSQSEPVHAPLAGLGLVIRAPPAPPAPAPPEERERRRSLPKRASLHILTRTERAEPLPYTPPASAPPTSYAEPRKTLAKRASLFFGTTTTAEPEIVAEPQPVARSRPRAKSLSKPASLRIVPITEQLPDPPPLSAPPTASAQPREPRRSIVKRASLFFGTVTTEPEVVADVQPTPRSRPRSKSLSKRASLFFNTAAAVDPPSVESPKRPKVLTKRSSLFFGTRAKSTDASALPTRASIDVPPKSAPPTVLSQPIPFPLSSFSRPASPDPLSRPTYASLPSRISSQPPSAPLPAPPAVPAPNLRRRSGFFHSKQPEPIAHGIKTRSISPPFPLVPRAVEWDEKEKSKERRAKELRLLRSAQACARQEEMGGAVLWRTSEESEVVDDEEEEKERDVRRPKSVPTVSGRGRPSKLDLAAAVGAAPVAVVGARRSPDSESKKEKELRRKSAYSFAVRARSSQPLSAGQDDLPKSFKPPQPVRAHSFPQNEAAALDEEKESPKQPASIYSFRVRRRSTKPLQNGEQVGGPEERKSVYSFSVRGRGAVDDAALGSGDVEEEQRAKSAGAFYSFPVRGRSSAFVHGGEDEPPLEAHTSPEPDETQAHPNPNPKRRVRDSLRSITHAFNRRSPNQSPSSSQAGSPASISASTFTTTTTTTAGSPSIYSTAYSPSTMTTATLGDTDTPSSGTSTSPPTSPDTCALSLSSPGSSPPPSETQPPFLLCEPSPLPLLAAKLGSMRFAGLGFDVSSFELD